MTEIEKRLLADLNYGKITVADLLERFPVDLQNNSVYIRNEVKEAINSRDSNSVEDAMSLIWLSGDPSRFTDLLNELLVNPDHISHQRIAKTLQDIKSPTTVPFVRKVLETNFDYLQYTSSDDEVIAKWFSWLLAEIGTKDAINLMQEYGSSTNAGIKKEMLYRLKRIGINRNPDPTSIKGAIDLSTEWWPL
jgi:hypothetical protein